VEEATVVDATVAVVDLTEVVVVGSTADNPSLPLYLSRRTCWTVQQGYGGGQQSSPEVDNLTRRGGGGRSSRLGDQQSGGGGGVVVNPSRPWHHSLHLRTMSMKSLNDRMTDRRIRPTTATGYDVRGTLLVQLQLIHC